MASPSEARPFHVASAESGQTLVSLLRHWNRGISWATAKQMLKSRRVSVNGAMCLDVGRRVKTGDVVHIHPYSRTPQPTAEDVQLLYWDNDVVVVVKPPLMTTLRHREERNWPNARKNLQPTLDECLPRLLQTAESGGVDPTQLDRHSQSRQRPGQRGGARGSSAHGAARGRKPQFPRVRAVHRLDRDTSGVMVFARHESAERGLIEQFKVHSIDRYYQAIVHGRPQNGSITRRLIRDRGDGLRGATDSPTEGESATTHIRLLEELGAYSLVECQLETGRTHQIRIHLSEAGHLLCGDPMYYRRLNAPPFDDQSGAPRLALHAARLGFTHPRTRERLDFEAELPDDLYRWIRRLRRNVRTSTDESTQQDQL